MTLRTALSNARVVTFAVLAGGIWLVLTVIDVASRFDWGAISTTDFIGQTAVGGIIGLVIMVSVLGLLVYLFGEIGETEPAPSSWPPE
ncbi:MAG: hypothetical protein ACI8XM_002213 [Haloarculaceae archaeon]|jgi:hypothetical protein